MTNWYFEGLKRLLAALKQATVVAEVGGTVADDPDFTSTTNPSALQVGMSIDSPQFPAGTTVLAVAGAVVTMSAPALATEVSPGAGVTGVLPAGILEPLSLHAVTGDIPVSAYTAFDALTEADFNGYAPKVLVPGPVQVTGPAGACLGYSCITWTPTNYAVVNTISGVAFTIPDGANTLLLASEVFEAPITLANAGQVLSMLPILNVPYNGGGPFSPIV